MFPRLSGGIRAACVQLEPAAALSQTFLELLPACSNDPAHVCRNFDNYALKTPPLPTE